MDGTGWNSTSYQNGVMLIHRVEEPRQSGTLDLTIIFYFTLHQINFLSSPGFLLFSSWSFNLFGRLSKKVEWYVLYGFQSRLMNDASRETE